MYYNAQLIELRNNKGLSIKEAAKGIGILPVTLSLYERGIFKPRKKILEKINNFYNHEIVLEGEDSYPIPIQQKKKNVSRKALLRRRIIFGVIAFLSAVSAVTGGIVFSQSVNNPSSYYGKVYNDLHTITDKQGDIAHEVVTGLEYRNLHTSNDDGEVISVVYYRENSLLYFNRVDLYNLDYIDGNIVKHTFQFGSNLGVSSYQGTYVFSSYIGAQYASCNFTFKDQEVTKISNLYLNKGAEGEVDEEFMLGNITTELPYVFERISNFMTLKLFKDVDFYDDFLAAREQGRVVNFDMQRYGITFLILGITFFFLFTLFFIRTFLFEYDVRHPEPQESQKDTSRRTLPTDISVPVGIPHRLGAYLFRSFALVSVLFVIMSVLASVGILPGFFADKTFAKAVKYINISFLVLFHLTIYLSTKNARGLGKIVLSDAYVYFFVASLETALFVVLDAWGYEFSTIADSYIPINYLGLFFCLSLTSLFLFTYPKFIAKQGKIGRAVWHSLAIFPIAALVVLQRVGLSYLLDYGVSKNIYVTIWFPKGYFILFMAVAAYLVATFFFRLYNEMHFSTKKAHIYFYGDKYALIETSILSICLIIGGIIDISLLNSQYASYMGIGGNYWYFILAILVFFIKIEPNYQESIGVTYINLPH